MGRFFSYFNKQLDLDYDDDNSAKRRSRKHIIEQVSVPARPVVVAPISAGPAEGLQLSRLNGMLKASD